MDIDRYETKLASIKFMAAHIKEIEQWIAVMPQWAEKSALADARVDLLQAMFGVYLMTA